MPVFAPDIKGDLSGLSPRAETNPKVDERAGEVGQEWSATGFPVEFFALGGEGNGVPAARDDEGFGPTLLIQVLGLNERRSRPWGWSSTTPTSRACRCSTSPTCARSSSTCLRRGQGRPEDLGGLSSATAGVILRELIAFSDQGADTFFGEPEFDTTDFLRTTADGKGVISLVELPNLQDRPAVFSTFLMWLLADLFHDLPEVGDIDKPKLVFFFDEAHLLFNDASKAFLDADRPDRAADPLQGRGRLLRDPVADRRTRRRAGPARLAIQHQLRAATPNDAKALKATVNTYPTRRTTTSAR